MGVQPALTEVAAPPRPLDEPHLSPLPSPASPSAPGAVHDRAARALGLRDGAGWRPRGRALLATLEQIMLSVAAEHGFAGEDARLERAPATGRTAYGWFGGDEGHCLRLRAAPGSAGDAAVRASSAAAALWRRLHLTAARVDLERPAAAAGGADAAALERALAASGWPTPFVCEVEPERPARALLHVQGADGRVWPGGWLTAAPRRVEACLGGPLEAMVATLLEQDRGWLPLALAPEQARVLPVGRRQRSYAEEVARHLARAGARVGAVGDEGPLPGRVAAALRARVPWVAVVGSREAAAGAVSLRRRASPGRAALEQVPLTALQAAFAAALDDRDNPPARERRGTRWAAEVAAPL